jgi:hypothetical protein
MAQGYKIRLGDGSEIGPMDRESVRAWYAQGLATKETPVLVPDSTRWVPLAQAIELKDLRSASQRSEAAARTAEAARASESTSARRAPVAAEVQTWPTRLAAALFAALGMVAAFLALWPERWTAALERTPWLHIAVVCVIFAFALHRAWEPARQAVQAACFLLALGGFGLLGLLVAQGMRGRPLLVVAAAIVLAGGFFALLSGGWQSWQRAGLAILTVAAGAAGVLFFGMAAGNPLADRILEWASKERRFSDEALGVSLEVPQPWLALRSEQPIVAVPPEARLAFGHPRHEGVGFLVVESAPKGVLSLDHYLERFLKSRRQAHPSLEPAAPEEVSLSGVKGRKVLSEWEDEGTRYVELTTVARDGWTFVALAAWMPASTAHNVPRELEALIPRLSLSGVLAERLQEAVDSATREVPHLNPTAAEMVMSQSAALALDPEATFRRAYRMASAGTSSLPREEFTELGRLNNAVFGSMPGRDRERLANYFDRVRRDDPTSPDEDRQMLRSMAGAVAKLPPPQLARLKELYEKAIRLAIMRE